jgi:molybdopterin synthase catalytic subunit/molybdopterin converting factor small subunit
MRARVLFFGSLKDVVGSSSDDAEFPDGADLHAVFERYAGRYPRIREMAGSIVLARNHEFARPTARLEDGDEVAFLPPLSGGSGRDGQRGWSEIRENGHWFALTRHPIDPPAIAAHLQTGQEGAVVTFEGTVRNNTDGRSTGCLDYEGYEPMALKMMAEIGRAIAASRPVLRIAIVHRLGRLLVGETSVAIIVTAAHRRPAFEAALEAIDRLKKTVPIWKKEHFADGEVWVEGEWDRDVPVAG